MLNDALDDEYRDYYKYMALAEDLTDEADSETVKSMAYDEYKHRRLLEEIYTAVTGSAPRPPQNIIQPRAGKYTIDDLTDSLFGELEGVELYRDIMFSLKNTTPTNQDCKQHHKPQDTWIEAGEQERVG